jgi:hypothetical protein
MSKLTNEEKAKIYNDLLFKFQRTQEQIRLIKANNFELSENDAKKVQMLESHLRDIYNQTQRLY